jgi:hypothetical protein
MKKLLAHLIKHKALRDIRFNDYDRIAKYGYDVSEIELLRRQYKALSDGINWDIKEGERVGCWLEIKFGMKLEKVIYAEYKKLDDMGARMDFQKYIRHLSHEIPYLNRVWKYLNPTILAENKESVDSIQGEYLAQLHKIYDERRA